jgi:hypothetical protein
MSYKHAILVDVSTTRKWRPPVICGCEESPWHSASSVQSSRRHSASTLLFKNCHSIVCIIPWDLWFSDALFWSWILLWCLSPWNTQNHIDLCFPLHCSTSYSFTVPFFQLAVILIRIVIVLFQIQIVEQLCPCLSPWNTKSLLLSPHKVCGLLNNNMLWNYTDFCPCVRTKWLPHLLGPNDWPMFLLL